MLQFLKWPQGAGFGGSNSILTPMLKKKINFYTKNLAYEQKTQIFFKFDALFTFHDNCVLCPYRLLVTVFKIFALFLFKPLTIP